jgi:hypothetical protein
MQDEGVYACDLHLAAVCLNAESIRPSNQCQKTGRSENKKPTVATWLSSAATDAGAYSGLALIVSVGASPSIAPFVIPLSALPELPSAWNLLTLSRLMIRPSVEAGRPLLRAPVELAGPEKKMSGSRRVTAEFTTAAAILAVSAGLFLSGAAQWTSTASASVALTGSEGSSILAKVDPRRVRVVLPSMYQPAGLAEHAAGSGVSAPLAQKGDLLGAIVFTAVARGVPTIAFEPVR